MPDATQMNTAVESADLLQDLIANAASVADGYRDPSIPEGALLGETTGLAGEQVRWKKQKSMVHAGAVPLPERFEAFDKFGHNSMLPTAQMSRMLSKPRADSPGERAFHTHTRGTTRQSCSICPEPKSPIEQTCEFCLERTAGAVTKVFYRENDVYSHKRGFHPQEFEAQERILDRAERRAQIEAQQSVAEAMLAMAQSQTAQPTPPAATPSNKPPKE